MNQQKSNFVSTARQTADAAAATIRQVRNLLEVWETLGYNPGGSNEITAEDLAGENAQITLAQLHAAMTAFDGMIGALSSEARAAIYSITINPGA
jgi:hypothetical protein